MDKARPLIILILCVLLSGCDLLNLMVNSSKEENERLKQALHRYESGQYLAEKKEAEERREATIAAVCNYLANICPESMTKVGNQLLKQGVKPEPKSSIWWWAVTFKFLSLALTLFVTAIAIDFYFSVLKKNHAKLAKIEAHRSELEKEEELLRDRLASIESAHTKEIQELSELYDKKMVVMNTLSTICDDLEEEKADLISEIEQLEEILNQKKSAANVVSSFKI